MITPSLPAVCGLKYGVSGGSLYPSTSGSFLVSAEGLRSTSWVCAFLSRSSAGFASTARGDDTRDSHEVTVRTGPDYLPVAPLRRRLELLARWFPPNRGYRQTPAVPRRSGPSPRAC